MQQKNIFIDLDGVVLNSEQKIKDLIQERKPTSKKEWDIFFDSIDWFELLKNSSSINNSVEILNEASSQNDNLMILTKIHTLLEAQAKVYDLRENRKINIPILFVPPHVDKSQIYIPVNNEILVDDSPKNIDNWNKFGGYGILFEENCEVETKNKVKSLEFLLKR